MWFPTRFDTNRPIQSQKRSRSLKFRIKVEEELYYPSSENKGADQLRGYCEADLPLCFCISRLLVFPWGGSNVKMPTTYLQTRHQNGDTYPLALDEILDETNQLDIGNKNKHWLATEVSIMELLPFSQFFSLNASVVS